MSKIKQAVAAAARAFRQAYNERGEEIPDTTPVAAAVKFDRPPSIHEIVAQHLRSEQWRMASQKAGVESFEEANDFDVGDEEFDDVPTLHEMQETFYNEARRQSDDFIKERTRGKGKGAGPAGKGGDSGGDPVQGGGVSREGEARGPAGGGEGVSGGRGADGGTRLEVPPDVE